MQEDQILRKEENTIILARLAKMHDELIEWYSPSIQHLESLANLLQDLPSVEVSLFKFLTFFLEQFRCNRPTF